jgi:hypothetical protein
MGKIVRSFFAVLVVVVPGSIHARAEIVDRVSIVVGTRVIKQSDIDRDIRVVSFLNQAPPDFSAQSRKESASRLIDQLLIRQDIQATGAAPAALGGMEQLLMQIKKDRFANDMQYRQALAKYGLSEEDLRSALLWQLTVLRFIDQRFGSATAISDQDIEKYFNSHRAELTKSHVPPRSADEVRPAVEAEISGERANQQFENWIDRTRKDTRIEYREESLR